MEVKINREIREYTENIFFGLSLRQFIFSILACLTTISLYFISNTYFEKETMSWICIVGALPFAMLGFFKYNGMPAEKILMCFIKTEFIVPKKIKFKSNNYYYELTKQKINQLEEELNNEDIKKFV